MILIRMDLRAPFALTKGKLARELEEMDESQSASVVPKDLLIFLNFNDQIHNTSA